MSLTDVNWSLIPAPSDDGKAAHLEGMSLPDISLPATTGGPVNLRDLSGVTVVYVYPMTGRPDRDLPIAILIALAAAGCTYVVITWIATAVVPLNELQHANAPLMEVVQTAAPDFPIGLFSVIALMAKPPANPSATAAIALPMAKGQPSAAAVISKVGGSIRGDDSQNAMTAANGAPSARSPARATSSTHRPAARGGPPLRPITPFLATPSGPRPRSWR